MTPEEKQIQRAIEREELMRKAIQPYLTGIAKVYSIAPTSLTMSESGAKLTHNLSEEAASLIEKLNELINKELV